MKHIFILSLLFAIVFFSAPVGAKKAAVPSERFGSRQGRTKQKVEDLDGKDLVVRLYNNWQEAPASFEKATVEVNGRTVRFDFNDVDDSAVVAFFGEDQEDEAIRQLIGDRIYGWDYKKGLEFSLPEKPPSERPDFWWTFNDALGNPIPNATVEIYLTDEERQILVGQGKTDSQAQLKLPFCLGHGESVLRVGKASFCYGTVQPRFVVSHPEYGMAVVNVYPDHEGNSPHTIFIPAVPPGSEADRRSIWGVVVDLDNNPVSGILIQATCVYPLGADLVCGIPRQRCSVPTDEQGRFRLYLPTKKDNEKIGTLIPPKSEYYVMIKPPKRLGLLPFKGKIPNGRETIITLERAGYFRTFVFEDEKGPIADTNQLRQITLYIERPGKSKLWFKYDDFKAGGLSPPGTYEARMNSAHGYKFEPIEVTADSPEQLVFKLQPSKLYYGQVVHGITGEPMPRAFVIDMGGICSQRNLSMLTPEQWDALHNLPPNPLAKDEGVAQLQKANCYSFTKLVRTDDNGWFEMTVPPKRDFYAFVVFHEGYLSVFVRNDKFEQDSNGDVAVRVTKLFPAAKVIVEPWVEGWSRGLLGIWPKWIINKDDNPDWVLDILAGCEKGLTKGIREDFALRPNKPQSFYVPAGLNLQIQLRFPHVKNLSPITIAERVNLQQGETLDLGRQEIQLVVKVFVKVMDPTGSPVEGLPVTALSSRYGGVTHNTDENGVAQFDMAEYSQGEFVVEYDGGDDPDAMHLREAIPYEIAGPEDANSIYTLQVSDEMLYQLFK